MHHPPVPQWATEMAKLTLVLPLRPGQSEPFRRFVQELQVSRRLDFQAACRRWGVGSMAIWLAPARPGDLVVAQFVLAADLADAEQRFACSQLPFDLWIKQRVRELHGVDLNTGLARYRAEILGVWQEPDPPAPGRLRNGR
jgi:hypothetical protein